MHNFTTPLLAMCFLMNYQPHPRSTPVNRQGKDITFKIMVTLKFKGLRLTGTLKQSQIPKLLQMPVRNGDTDPKRLYGVTLTWPNGNTHVVYTCQQWKQAVAAKAYPAFTYDMAMNGYYISTCTLLYSLQNATLPRISFISHPRVTLANLSLLPAQILGFMPYSKKKEDRLRSLTIAQVVPVKKIKIVNNNTLRLSYSGLDQIFWEGARADFNRDGYEDILIYTFGHAIGGTMTYSDYFILTRTHPSGPLKVINIPEP